MVAVVVCAVTQWCRWYVRHMEVEPLNISVRRTRLLSVRSVLCSVTIRGIRSPLAMKRLFILFHSVSFRFRFND